MLPPDLQPLTPPFLPSPAARGRALGLAALLIAGLAPSTGSSASAPVVVPTETLSLFNGRDLSAFTSWIPSQAGQDDPDQVFTIVDQIDGAPAIRISGQHFGGLVTRENYSDYKLVAEFRWGPVTWRPRQDKARDSGLLLHCQGEVGNVTAAHDSPWMRSVEYQIIEGGTGDIILLSGYERGQAEPIPTHLTVPVLPGTRIWNPRGEATRFERGRINWQHRDPAWKDVLGVRGPKDVEKPVGEWNRLEIISDGNRLEYFLNGVKVNEGTNGTLKSGRILVQSEGAELYFRRIELQPLAR